MRFSIPVFVVAALVCSAPVLAQPDNIDELAANPQYMEKDVKPTFKAVTAADLQKGVKVISGRSYAVFGFNTPEVQIHFPQYDNNVYAQIKFSEAALVDENGNEVAYERENGFYTHDTFSSETRFASTDGESIVAFARAKGSIRVRYPARIKTVSVKTSDAAAMEKAGIIAESAYVRIYEHGGIAEEEFSSPIEGLRAYDAKGKRLEKYMGYSSGGSDEVGDYRGVAYHGVPARFDADVVEQWIGVEFEYDLPPAPLWPDSRQGFGPEEPVKIVDTPGGKVTSKEVRILAPEVLGWYADMSRAELEEQVRQYGYPEISEDALRNAAAQGEIDAVRIMLAAGVSPDAGGSDGMSALISAAAIGQNETALLLIQAGANVNLVDENNSSALLWASQRCDNAELIEALIKAGADVNIQAKGTATPMMMATVMNCEENKRLLKAAGAKDWKPGQ